VGLALDLEDCHPSVLLHCWLGLLTCKIVSEMTYNVLSGTLNPTIQYSRAPGTNLTVITTGFNDLASYSEYMGCTVVDGVGIDDEDDDDDDVI